LNDELELVITPQSGGLALVPHQDDLLVEPMPTGLAVTVVTTAAAVTVVKGDLTVNPRGINDVEVSYGG
jgi:hypothetical protein